MHQQDAEADGATVVAEAAERADAGPMTSSESRLLQLPLELLYLISSFIPKRKDVAATRSTCHRLRQSTGPHFYRTVTFVPYTPHMALFAAVAADPGRAGLVEEVVCCSWSRFVLRHQRPCGREPHAASYAEPSEEWLEAVNELGQRVRRRRGKRRPASDRPDIVHDDRLLVVIARDTVRNRAPTTTPPCDDSDDGSGPDFDNDDWMIPGNGGYGHGSRAQTALSAGLRRFPALKGVRFAVVPWHNSLLRAPLTEMPTVREDTDSLARLAEVQKQDLWIMMRALDDCFRRSRLPPRLEIATWPLHTLEGFEGSTWGVLAKHVARVFAGVSVLRLQAGTPPTMPHGEDSWKASGPFLKILAALDKPTELAIVDLCPGPESHWRVCLHHVPCLLHLERLSLVGVLVNSSQHLAESLKRSPKLKHVELRAVRLVPSTENHSDWASVFDGLRTEGIVYDELHLSFRYWVSHLCLWQSYEATTESNQRLLDYLRGKLDSNPLRDGTHGALISTC